MQNCPVNWCSITEYFSPLQLCNPNSFASYSRETPFMFELTGSGSGWKLPHGRITVMYISMLIWSVNEMKKKILIAFAIKSEAGKSENPVLFSLQSETDCAKWAWPKRLDVCFFFAAADAKNVSAVLWKRSRLHCKNSHLGNAGLF